VIIFKDAPTGDTPPTADTIILDDFSSIRTNGSIWGTAGTATVWYDNGGFDTPTASGGVLNAGLGNPNGGGAGQHNLWFRANDDSGSFGWKFIRTAIEGGTFVKHQTNRMRFHIKMPIGYEHDPDGGFAPIHFGTYGHLEDDDDGAGMSGSDDENRHFYHYMNIPGDGLYWEAVWDSLPDHQRGASGSDEHGDWDFPDSVNHTFLSTMTAFYFDLLNPMSSSDVMLIKNFTMFSELGYDEATWRQVRTPQYVFDPATNTIKCGWNRRKDQPDHAYTIRWAHAPFASFTGGNLVGTINAPNTANNNTVYTEFSNVALAGHQWAWVAIQPSGASSFRQFAVDLELNA
jgi:hypothetical protein